MLNKPKWPISIHLHYDTVIMQNFNVYPHSSLSRQVMAVFHNIKHYLLVDPGTIMRLLENQALCAKQRYRRYYFPPMPNPFAFATKKQPSDNDVDIKQFHYSSQSISIYEQHYGSIR